MFVFFFFLITDEFAHMMLTREGVVRSWVVEGAGGAITDLCSFYHLPSTIIGNEKYNKLHAVYSYYNVATTMTMGELMQDLLILARDSGADVFNALDLMDNEPTFEPLKFGQGDGHLQYYLFNWKVPEVQPREIGIVLL